jgi:hypothetical protein
VRWLKPWRISPTNDWQTTRYLFWWITSNTTQPS